MERAPSLDASPPSPLRLAGFLMTVVGALLIGVGSVLTWVTVGLADRPQVDTVTPGVDVVDGMVALACAVILLVCLLATRMVTEPRIRTTLAATIVIAGAIAATVAGFFLVTAHGRFDPVSNDDLIEKLATALQQPVDTVRDELRATLEALGGFTRVGIGPVLVLAGGVLGSTGGFLTLLWTWRRSSDEGAVQVGSG
jgi:hypothetical protein